MTLALFLLYPVKYGVSGLACEFGIGARDCQRCWRQVANRSTPAFTDSRASKEISQAVQMADDCGCQLLILEHVFIALHRDSRL